MAEQASDQGFGFAEEAIGSFTRSLGARQPTPGGGSAAAVAAAVGAALGAMAARYTTGKRWADREEETRALAEELERQADELLTLADQDAIAYRNLQASWRDPQLSRTEQDHIASQAQAVPAAIISSCAQAASRLSEFLPRCNPRILSDARAAIHLLDGAVGAAWETYLVNEPDDLDRSASLAHCRTLRTIRDQLDAYR